MYVTRFCRAKKIEDLFIFDFSPLNDVILIIFFIDRLKETRNSSLAALMRNSNKIYGILKKCEKMYVQHSIVFSKDMFIPLFYYMIQRRQKIVTFIINIPTCNDY